VNHKAALVDGGRGAAAAVGGREAAVRLREKGRRSA